MYTSISFLSRGWYVISFQTFSFQAYELASDPTMPMDLVRIAVEEKLEELRKMESEWVATQRVCLCDLNCDLNGEVDSQVLRLAQQVQDQILG